VRTTRHVASAGAVTSATAPQWQVELRTGARHMVADEPAINGGGDTGPSPFGLLLGGLAACTAITLRMYAEREAWTLAAIEVDVRYDIADDGQASITRTITVPAELCPTTGTGSPASPNAPRWPWRSASARRTLRRSARRRRRRRLRPVPDVTTSSTPWPGLPYEAWHDTCDTLHAHTQVLGKLAVALAPPEPQLQHAALRLTARGWESHPLPAPDASGALVVALDLHRHEAVAEHSDGRVRRTPLAPDRPVGDVTRELLLTVADLVGPVQIDPRPQETPWTRPLDHDYDHATYNPSQVEEYFVVATQAALVLAALRAPYRGRSTPVNAWWGTFDLAVSLFSGQAVDPPSNDFITRNSANAKQIEVGWGPETPAIRNPPSSLSRSPRPTGSTKQRSRRPRHGGTPRWVNTSSTGTTSAAPTTRAKQPSTSDYQRSAMPAWSAAGILTSPPAPRATRRRSPRGGFLMATSTL
jgi:hypothetical protein